MVKRLISLLLVVLVIFNLTACGKGNTAGAANTNTDNMYYAEEELGGASDWLSVNGIRLNSKKQMVIYDEGTNHQLSDGKAAVPRFITLDAEGREISSFDCKHQTEEKRNTVRSLFTLDSKDYIYLLNVDVEKHGENEAEAKYFKNIYVYTPDGSLAKVLILGENESDMDFIYNIMVDSKGNLYTSSMTGLKAYDQNGTQINKTDSEKFFAADIVEDDNIMFIRRGKGQLEIGKYDPASGKTVWSKELKEQRHPNAIFYSPEDKHIYVSDDNVISKYDNKGNYISQLLDYSDTGIIPMEQYVSGFVVDASDRIYMTVRQNNYEFNGKTFGFYKYTLTKDAGSKASRKVLTISMLHQDRMLETMAKKFQQKHPDIKVEIRSMSEEGNITSDEEIKKFNAEIMSGKASDLICLEGLPYKKYIEKNIFEDLSKIISGDNTFDEDQLYKNIIDACKYKGKLYAMPISFTFDAVQVDKALTDAQGIKLEEDGWTWKSFTEAAVKLTEDKNGDGKADVLGLAKTDPLKLFEYVFSSSMNKFVDIENKLCHFDSEEFIELLKMIKALSSNNIMHSKLDFDALYQEGSRGTIGFNFVDDMGTFEYTVSKYMLGDKAEVYAMPTGGKEVPRSFDASLYAISSSSGLKAEAWEFIKFLTSDETFNRDNPVNKNASENMMKEMMNEENSCAIAVSNESGKTRTIIIEPLTSKQYEHMRSTIASLGQLNDYNRQLKAIIEGELAAYLNDQRSAEDVAKLIQNRVNIYLNE